MPEVRRPVCVYPPRLQDRGLETISTKQSLDELGDAFEPTFADAFHRVHRHLASGVHAHDPEHVIGERHCS